MVELYLQLVVTRLSRNARTQEIADPETKLMLPDHSSGPINIRETFSRRDRVDKFVFLETASDE